MGSFGGFYKGEKKKPKQAKKKKNQPAGMSDRPVFSLPKIIEKRKKDY